MTSMHKTEKDDSSVENTCSYIRTTDKPIKKLKFLSKYEKCCTSRHPCIKANNGAAIISFASNAELIYGVQRFPNKPVRRTNPVKINSVRKNIWFPPDRLSGIKYWVCCIKEPCLISNLSIIYFD